MKHILPDFSFPADPHQVVGNADFSVLDNLYAGRKAYYGDYHVHSNSGGTSDGKTTPEEWLQAMKELKMDFVGLMDHRQVRHQYLDCFDPELFLYGSEPAGLWNEPNLVFHYLMIFQDRGGLERVLEKFPDVFQFEGGVEGHFSYIRVDRDRFMEMKDAVLAEGGAFVHPHPKQCMESDRLDDFDFGDGTAMEIVYTITYPEQLNPHTQDNYRLWMDMLAAGKKMVNTSTSDAHGGPTNSGVNTVYSAEKKGSAYVKKLREGDLNSGYVGIKMTLSGHPVGATADYVPGMQLQIKIDDAHPLLFDPDEPHRVDVITDQGLAYSAPLTKNFALALQAQPRKFYRVEVIREKDGSPAAIGNPIWLNI